MNRRRYLSVIATITTNPLFDFPITLVEGDNGQLGIDLFNYLINILPDNYEHVTIPNDDYNIGNIIIKIYNSLYYVLEIWKVQNDDFVNIYMIYDVKLGSELRILNNDGFLI